MKSTIKTKINVDKDFLNNVLKNLHEVRVEMKDLKEQKKEKQKIVETQTGFLFSCNSNFIDVKERENHQNFEKELQRIMIHYKVVSLTASLFKKF